MLSFLKKGGIAIKQVLLTMDEQRKYEVIKRLVENGGNKDRAALTLGISRRQVNRLIHRYSLLGKEAFVHGNRGRKPATAVPESVRRRICRLYREKYFGANFTHFQEILRKHENISLSVSSVSSILKADYILSPLATKAGRRRMRMAIAQREKASSAASSVPVEPPNVLDPALAHPCRSRCAYFGELLQMDATPFEWVAGSIWHLHLAIDDATGTVVGAWFDSQETLDGYYHVLHQILSVYGIPYKFLTDRRTVFTYKKKSSPSLDGDTYTQFAYACKQLGIALESTSIPQAKGRVERLNGTLQSRLPLELRLAGISTMEAANEFLNSYIKEFNAKFALPIDDTKSVFEAQPDAEKMNLVLGVLDKRTVDAGCSIHFQKRLYRALNGNGDPVPLRKGTVVMVVKAFDGRLFCCVDDTDVYALEEIQARAAKSPDFDADYAKPRPRKKYIPPMSHPWKKASYDRFVRSQRHHLSDSDSVLYPGTIP